MCILMFALARISLFTRCQNPGLILVFLYGISTNYLCFRELQTVTSIWIYFTGSFQFQMFIYLFVYLLLKAYPKYKIDRVG